MKIMITLGRLQGGGAERVAVVWADALVKLGHQVVLATNKDFSDAPFVYPINPKVMMSNCFKSPTGQTLEKDLLLRKKIGLPYRIYKVLTYYIKCHIALRKEIKHFKPDVILGVMNIPSIQSLIASIGLGCKVVSTEHNSFERPSSAPLSMSMRFFKCIANKWFPLVSVLTTADKEYISNRLKNVQVMPNPLALTPISSPLPNKQKRILAAGRLSAWHYKGFDILIKAWGKIAHKYPDWLLDIAGTGDEKSTDYLQSLINDEDISSQTILSGFHDDMSKYYAESEIFVLSSRYEGFGMVLIEAMSQGCACIAADYKGRQKEILGSENTGMIIKPDDVEGMSKAMAELIENKDLRLKMQYNAIEKSKDFKSSIIAEKWLNLFYEKFGLK